jgi:hypothetical protein
MNAKPTTSFLYRTTQLKSGYWRHSVTAHMKHRFLLAFTGLNYNIAQDVTTMSNLEGHYCQPM